MTRVLYSTTHFLDWIDVAEAMSAQHAWEPCYWITYPGVDSCVAEAFPSVIRHPYLLAVRGIPPKELARDVYTPLDEPTLMQFRDCEARVLEMLNRLDAGCSFAYQERIRHYHRLLSYWLWAIDEIKPEVAVFSATPHLGSDYVAYEVLRSRGIPTLVFGETSLPRSVFIRMDYRDDPVGLSEAYQRAQSSCMESALGEADWLALVEDATLISDETKEYLRGVRQDYERARPEYMRKQLSSVAADTTPAAPVVPEDRPLTGRVVNALKVWRWPLYTRNLVGAQVRSLLDRGSRAEELEEAQRLMATEDLRHGYDLFKLPGVPIERSWMTRRQVRQTHEAGHRLKHAMRETYASKTEPTDLSKPFVYVSLHYQPERTTVPEAGDYSDQLLMVGLVHDALPDGWGLYVREHPSQFVPKLSGEQGRLSTYYDDLLGFPKVRLVSHDLAPFDLIDSAKAVVTATGTAGWEAVLRGTPAMVFGTPWYRLCDGVFSVKSASDVTRAIEAIRGGCRPNGRKVFAFILALQEAAVRASTNQADRRERPADLSLADNVAQLCSLLSAAADLQ